MRFSIRLLPVLLLALAPMASAHEGLVHEGCDAGQSFTAGGITVSAAFTRAMLPRARVGGGYMTIANAGPADDRLLGATSEAAAIVQLHEMRLEGDMMRMGELPDGLVIPSGATAVLSPGGLHLMFLDIPTPFKEGECLQLTLSFEKAGELPIVLQVAGPAAHAAPDPHAGH